jgi:hypothetical protein
LENFRPVFFCPFDSKRSRLDFLDQTPRKLTVPSVLRRRHRHRHRVIEMKMFSRAQHRRGGQNRRTDRPGAQPNRRSRSASPRESDNDEDEAASHLVALPDLPAELARQEKLRLSGLEDKHKAARNSLGSGGLSTDEYNAMTELVVDPLWQQADTAALTADT